MLTQKYREIIYFRWNKQKEGHFHRRYTLYP